jgi:predicted aldo/keto reductase-like oxidoreductase
MQYRREAKTGKELSALGFGCMRFPPSGALREELIMSAYEAGVNYFDTAYLYPGSESSLGGILKKHGVREKVFIADKLPHTKCRSSEDFDAFFRESLSRLQTDYIDYYLIHNIGELSSWERLTQLGIEDWIADKKQGGEIRAIGFSFHGAPASFVPLLDAYDWDFCQIQYNYMNETNQAGTAGLRAINEGGMAAIIMEPLLGGKLADKLPRTARDLFDAVVPNRTPAAWALKWLWDKPEITVVLSGMNAMSQLKENLELVSSSPVGCLTDKERAAYKKAREAISESYRAPCTGCNYCMPCPHGVNIPACFNGYNMSYVLGFIGGITQYINGTASFSVKNGGAGKCVGCGVCAAKCPQKIDIPDKMVDVKRRMEPFYVRAALVVVRKFMS